MIDHDTKVTYVVITLLIVVLGGIAYFLQGNMDLPQVQVEQLAASSTQSIETTNKTQTTTTKATTTINKITTKATTTMNLPEKITSATITTNKGVIEIVFATDTPHTVQNFAKLAVSGFYDGTRFHRVIRDFMIQGGDPLSKDVAQKMRWGTGGPGYTFKDEFHAGDQFAQGTLAMANAGPNTNGSQFFIVTAVAGTPWLIGKHTVFGHVTKGLDVALSIGNTSTDSGDRPVQDVIVQKIDIK